MGLADNFCPLCGARRQATDPGGPGYQQQGSYQQGDYQQPGSYQQQGDYQQPGGYPPGSYQQPRAYQSQQPPGYRPQGGYPAGQTTSGYPAGQTTSGYPAGQTTSGYPAGQTTNGLAIASLVLGLVWIFWLGSALALVFGLISLSQIKRNNQRGRSLAIAGIVLGGIGVAFLLLAVIAGTAARSTSPAAF